MQQITTHHDVPFEQLSWLEHNVEAVCLSRINVAERDINVHYTVSSSEQHQSCLQIIMGFDGISYQTADVQTGCRLWQTLRKRQHAAKRKSFITKHDNRLTFWTSEHILNYKHLISFFFLNKIKKKKKKNTTGWPFLLLFIY